MLTEYRFNFIRIVIQLVKARSRNHYNKVKQKHLLIFALQIVQQFFRFGKGLFKIVGDNIGIYTVL